MMLLLQQERALAMRDSADPSPDFVQGIVQPLPPGTINQPHLWLGRQWW